MALRVVRSLFRGKPERWAPTTARCIMVGEELGAVVLSMVRWVGVVGLECGKLLLRVFDYGKIYGLICGLVL